MGFKDWLDKITGRDSSSAPAAGWSTNGDQIAGTTSPAPPTEADILEALDRLNASVSGGVVPAVVASRVAKVSQTIRDTLPRLRNVGLGSLDAYSVMATATDPPSLDQPAAGADAGRRPVILSSQSLKPMQAADPGHSCLINSGDDQDLINADRSGSRHRTDPVRRWRVVDLGG